MNRPLRQKNLFILELYMQWNLALFLREFLARLHKSYFLHGKTLYKPKFLRPGHESSEGE